MDLILHGLTRGIILHYDGSTVCVLDLLLFPGIQSAFYIREYLEGWLGCWKADYHPVLRWDAGRIVISPSSVKASRGKIGSVLHFMQGPITRMPFLKDTTDHKSHLHRQTPQCNDKCQATRYWHAGSAMHGKWIYDGTERNTSVPREHVHHTRPAVRSYLCTG